MTGLYSFSQTNAKVSELFINFTVKKLHLVSVWGRDKIVALHFFSYWMMSVMRTGWGKTWATEQVFFLQPVRDHWLQKRAHWCLTSNSPSSLHLFQDWLNPQHYFSFVKNLKRNLHCGSLNTPLLIRWTSKHFCGSAEFWFGLRVPRLLRWCVKLGNLASSLDAKLGLAWPRFYLQCTLWR